MGTNPVDILVWIVLPVFSIRGFLRGLTSELASLAGLVVGGWSAFRFHPALSSSMKQLVNLPSGIATALSFLLIFGTVVLLFQLAGSLLTSVLKIALLGGVNRLGGLVFGAMEGIVVLSLVLYLGVHQARSQWLADHLQRSTLAGRLSAAGEGIISGWEARAAGAVLKAAVPVPPGKK